jgi:hypothetical protein
MVSSCKAHDVYIKTSYLQCSKSVCVSGGAPRHRALSPVHDLPSSQQMARVNGALRVYTAVDHSPPITHPLNALDTAQRFQRRLRHARRWSGRRCRSMSEDGA